MQLYEREMIDRARQLAGEYGFVLAPNAEAELRRLIRRGLERIGGEGRPIDNEEGKRALAALNEFVMRMTQNAALELREGVDQEPGQVRDDDFEAAFAALCPGFWPFC